MNIMSKKTFLIPAVIVIVVVLAVGMAIYSQLDEDTQGPNITDGVTAPESSIGKTTIEELRRRPGLISEEKIDDNTTQFQYESGVYLHPDIVEAEKGVAIFEAITVNPDEFEEDEYPHIIDYLTEYGDPELVIEGSTRYGPFTRTYVYSSLGFSFAGNPATDEIFEFEYFVPMSIQEYAEKHGDQIRNVESHQHEEEHI